jgi:hypothetical protein
MSKLAARRGPRIIALVIAALLCAAAARADPFRWPQPNGRGTPVFLTYSYSNLLSTDFDGIPVRLLRAATQEALGLWSSYAPLFFFERPDAGPPAADRWYDANGFPEIRIGAHGGFDDSELAHAYFPVLVDSSGLAGDVHLNNDATIQWSLGAGFPSIDFLEVMTHELGHSLGLLHDEDPSAIMYRFHGYRFHGLGTGFLSPRDIGAIQSVYGAGSGAVVPMSMPEPATLVLIGTGLLWTLTRRARARRGLVRCCPGRGRDREYFAMWREDLARGLRGVSASARLLAVLSPTAFQSQQHPLT